MKSNSLYLLEGKQREELRYRAETGVAGELDSKLKRQSGEVERDEGFISAVDPFLQRLGIPIA